MAVNYPRPKQPLLDPTHPSARALQQMYVASNPNLNAHREVVSGKLLTGQPAAFADFSSVTDKQTNGNVLFLNCTGAGTDSIIVPYSNKWTSGTTANAWSGLMRAKIVTMTATPDIFLAASNSGGDGAHLHNNSATTVYSFIAGISSPTLTVNFVWETYMWRFNGVTGIIELQSWTDDGMKNTASGGTTSGAPATMTFTANVQSLMVLSTSGNQMYLDFFITWSRFVSDGEIGWFLRNR